MHNDHALVEARLGRFIRDHLAPAQYRDVRPLAASAWEVPGEPVPFADAANQRYTPAPIGWRWGRAFQLCTVRLRGVV